MLTAQSQGSRVEDLSARTETSKTYANPDGTWTVVATTEPTRFKDANGQWQDVDLTLAPGTDGSVHAKGHPAGLHLGAAGGAPGRDRELFTLARGGHSLGLQWTGALPAPTLDKADPTAATYRGAAPGVDLKVQALRTGAEESLLLTQRPAQPTAKYTIPLALKGLRVVAAAGGAASLVDAAGKAEGFISAPVMWDAQTDASGGHPHQGKVTMSVASRGNGAAVLTLTPDPAFLADPSTTYPVTIDPTATFGDSVDLNTSSLYPTTAYYKPADLKVGISGSEKSRSYLNFTNWTVVRGTHVLSASLSLFNNWSYSCSTRAVNVYEPTAAWTYQTTWNTQPGWAKLAGSASFAAGASGCAASYESIDVKTAVTDWANYAAASGQLILAASETDAYAAKKFNSVEKNGTGVPTITATYNSYPNTPTSPSPYSGLITANTNPTLSATVSDPDGGYVQGLFYVYDVTTGTWVTQPPPPPPGPNAPYGNTVTTNNVSSFTTPTLTDGHHYQWEVYASDTVPDTSVNSAGWFDLYVDTSAPTYESISCTHPSGTWVNVSSDTESCTFSASDAHLTQFGWWLDGVWEGYVSQSGASATVSPTFNTPGLHNVVMSAFDAAGNQGTQMQWTIGLGSAGMQAPAADTRSSARFPVRASAPAGSSAFLRWAPDGTSSWTQISNSTVKLASTGAAWDGSVSATSSGVTTPDLVWDSSLSGIIDPAHPTPRVINLQACFTGSNGTACTGSQRVSVLTHSFGGAFATSPVGPGQVSLSTGELSLSDIDASLSGYYDTLSVSRGYTSLSGPVAGSGGVLGPHWSLSAPSNGSDSADLTVLDSTGADRSLAFQGADGSVAIYSEPSGASGADAPGTYVPLGGTQTDGDTVTMTGTGSGPFTLKLTSTSGVSTTWTRASSASAWVLSSSAVSVPTGTTAAPGSASPTTWAYDTTTGHLTRVTATIPGVDCTTAPLTTRGCRSLTFTYASTTTGTSTAFGGYVGQLSEIDEVAWNPAANANAGAMSTQAVACYAYDNNGLLRQEWDPRPGQAAGADLHCDPAHPVLPVRYDYDSATSGRVTAITPPGAAGWSFTYDSTGRLSTVARQDADRAGGAGTDTTTFVYSVPLSGTNLPDLSNTAAWGQTVDTPVTGVAVFAPDHQPTLTGGVPASSDWPYATITYLDATGRGTNTGAYGANTWTVDSRQYDAHDNVTWSLRADGWAEAAANASTRLSVAQARASYNFYNAEGTELLDSYGPEHDLTLSAGTVEPNWRTHTHNDYDNSTAPWGSPYRLQIATYTWASSTADPTSLTDAQRSGETRTDVRSTTFDYSPVQSTDGDGKRLGIPVKTTTTVDATTSVTRVTRSDPDGHPIAVSQPNDTAGTGAGTTLTAYYAHAATGVCGQHDEWIGLACTTGPAAQPASGLPLPITTVTGYSMLLAPTSTTEAAPGGVLLRSTSTGYDAAGRPTTSSVSSAITGDVPVADTTTTYDPATGQVASVATANGTISESYDSLGRVKTYTDADGQLLTSTTYDADSRPVTVATPVGTTTYTYDSDSGQVEHRGLLTAVDSHLVKADGTTVPSLTTAQYDAAGRPSRIDYPGGISARRTYDAAGQTTALDYSQNGAGLAVTAITNPDGTHPLLDFTASYNGFGQIAGNSSPQSHQTYSYDGLGRLTQVADTVDGVSNGAGGYTTQCTVRTYSLDGDSNRTALNSYAGAAGGACPTVDSTTTATFTRAGAFDAADRLTATTVSGATTASGAYTYDGLGRTTTLPAVDAGGTGTGDVTLGYFANDMVATQTQGGITRTWTLDPAERLHSWQDTGGTSTAVHVNHYVDGGDAPGWVDEGNGTWTRNLLDPTGDLALVATGTGTGTAAAATGASAQLHNLHGDVVATMDAANPGSSVSSYAESTEFGAPRDPSTAYSRYGWLGDKRRSSDDLAGLVLMGVRQYNPLSGRFLSVDPIVGANGNAYIHPVDPISSVDLSGEQPSPVDNHKERPNYLSEEEWRAVQKKVGGKEPYDKSAYKRAVGKERTQGKKNGDVRSAGGQTGKQSGKRTKGTRSQFSVTVPRGLSTAGSYAARVAVAAAAAVAAVYYAGYSYVFD